MDRVGLKDAINKEFAQLTKLEVGYWLKDEQEAKSLCQKFGIQAVGTRWVLVQKPDRVRARLVCKEFRSQGLSSLREGLYAPTASSGSIETVSVHCPGSQLVHVWIGCFNSLFVRMVGSG